MGLAQGKPPCMGRFFDVRIIYYPAQPPFNVRFPLREKGRCCREGYGSLPLREKGMVLSERLRGLFDRPFKVVFPCGKAGCAFDNCITHSLLCPFYRARFTVSPCDSNADVSEFRPLAASVTVQASFAAACLSFVDYKSAQHYNLYQRTP